LIDSFDLGADGTVPTVQKFDFGHYFSFTYNLGKAKSKEEQAKDQTYQFLP